MTLEKAIKHAEEAAEEQKELYRLCPASESDMFHCDGTKDCRVLKNGKDKGCRKLAEEHKQLAEWLKELKQLREQVSNSEYTNKCKESASLIASEEILRRELLERGDEMISFRQLVERFDAIEEAYPDQPWNLVQIYNNFNSLIGEKPKNRWIPVSERFPEENGSYFVTVQRGYVMIAIWVGTVEFWDEVIAWMPLPKQYNDLPKPYKVSSTGEEV